MPKAGKLSTEKRAVLARERREREKKDNEYNAALKGFLRFKYNHIITEFNPFYESMVARRPANLVYTNTNEFRLWQKREMEKAFSPSNGKEDEQLSELLPEQQQRQQDEQLAELMPEQDEQLPELMPEQQRQQDEQLAELMPEQDEQLPELMPEQQRQQDEQLAELMPEQDEQLPELMPEQQRQQDEQLAEQLPDLDELVNELVSDVDDEGIGLDVWEELQGDIEDFNYRLEVELDLYL